MSTRAIVFDYGGVICFPPSPENETELERLTGLPAETLRERAGCEYGEIVFFDDVADNVEKARKLGIQGFLWEGPEIARKRIALL